MRFLPGRQTPCGHLARHGNSSSSYTFCARTILNGSDEPCYLFKYVGWQNHEIIQNTSGSNFYRSAGHSFSICKDLHANRPVSRNLGRKSESVSAETVLPSGNPGAIFAGDNLFVWFGFPGE